MLAAAGTNYENFHVSGAPFVAVPGPQLLGRVGVLLGRFLGFLFVGRIFLFGFRFLGVRCGLLLAAILGGVVGLVPASPLEVKGGSRLELFQGASALGALGQGIIREFLNHLEVVGTSLRAGPDRDG